MRISKKFCKFEKELRTENMFNSIEIDRSNLTIMKVKFSNLKTLENTANALGSNMFEGFKSTPKGIAIIRDYVTGKISLSELVAFANKKYMSNFYKYIYPDYTYTDPKTGLLRNLQDITDKDVLLFVEIGAVTKRLLELYENSI